MRHRPPRLPRAIRPALKMGVGLGRGGASSAAPTAPSWPTTNLLVAYDFGNAVPTSGTLTSWPKTAGSGGATLTPTGTVTNGAGGVTVNTSYVSDAGVTLGAANATFSFYAIGSRTASNQIIIFMGGILASNDTFMGLYSDGNFYSIDQANAAFTLACSVSGAFLFRYRRSAGGEHFIAATGFAEASLGTDATRVYSWQTIASRPWVPDYSSTGSTHDAFAAYAEDVVAAGTATAIEAAITAYYGVSL